MTSLLPADLPPFGGLRTERGHLPLVAMDVRADVAGLLATTRLRQTFENHFDDAIEATYIFPLPDRAGVTTFVAVLAGRRVEGVLKERQAARDEYDEAIAAGRRAAILEEDRPGVFSARLGNLQPGETADVELELTGPVSYDDGEATFRFPLVVTPRYVPGEPLEGASVGGGTAVDTDLVPDASRISPPVLLPGQPNPVRLSIELAIDPLGFDLADLRSTLHAVVVEQQPLTVSLQPGERLDRDFVLRFRLAGAAPATAAVVVPDGDGDGGTYAVTVVPPAGAAADRERLDVAVVLDRSGSMAGWKMVAARRAAARVVDALAATDRFAVVAFDDRIERPERLDSGLVPATDRNRFAAVEFLSKLQARGGTDMHSALDEAMRALPGGGVLVLVTDGQIAQEDIVLHRMGPHLGRTRVFTVGIDRAVNAGFLQRLAEMTGGRAELVESEDRLDEAMTRIHRAVTPPVVESIEVDPGATDLVAESRHPARPTDLHAGAPVVLSGRYRARPDTITVRGGRGWAVTVEPRRAANPAVRTAWARAHVRDLEDRYAVDADPERADGIIRASLTYGVLSRFTAFVAVDPSDPAGSTSPRPVVQPVESPSMWPVAKLAMYSPAGVSAAAPAPMIPAPTDDSRLRELLDQLDDTVPDDLADELERIADALPKGKLRRAVKALAEAVRSGRGVEAKADAVRKLLDPDRAGGRFWT